jgi:uncharacterized DUF497 family protein
MYNVGVEFDWDARNVRHIARHGITTEEAEQVLRNDPLVLQYQNHVAEERVLCLGQTNNGRLLAVVYVERDSAIRIVTAYTMNRQQEEIYFRER